MKSTCDDVGGKLDTYTQALQTDNFISKPRHILHWRKSKLHLVQSALPQEHITGLMINLYITFKNMHLIDNIHYVQQYPKPCSSGVSNRSTLRQGCHYASAALLGPCFPSALQSYCTSDK